ncbi:Hypothetical protein NocV09_04700300, partial [Nannochloropsis oceanica]
MAPPTTGGGQTEEDKHQQEEIRVLHAASMHGRTDVIKAVITELGKTGLPYTLLPSLLSTPRDDDGATALHIAAMHGQARGTAGAVAGKRAWDMTSSSSSSSSKEVQQAFVMEGFRRTALGEASGVRELVEGGVPLLASNGTSPHDTMLHWAACFGHVEVLQELFTLSREAKAA